MEYEINIQCPLCYKEGIEKSETEGDGFPKYKLCTDCIKATKHKWVKNINNKGVEYEYFTFGNFVVSKENQKGVDICKQFASRKIDRFGLVLYSPNAGNGKTHLSFATLKQWILESYEPQMDRNSHHVPCPYIETTETDLLLRIRSTYKTNGGEDESDVIDEYKNADFMILDDIGKTNPNDLSFMQRTIYTIIDYRYLRHKLTIVSSNKNGAELQQYLGAYTFDRIRGMSHKVTEIHGESQRGKNGQ
jgi:DNA replication protein DnaC